MIKRKMYQVRYYMINNTGRLNNTGKEITFPSIFTHEYYEDAVDELLGLRFEPCSTLGSSFSWKRETGREGFYTLGTIESGDEE